MVLLFLLKRKICFDPPVLGNNTSFSGSWAAFEDFFLPTAIWISINGLLNLDDLPEK